MLDYRDTATRDIHPRAPAAWRSSARKCGLTPTVFLPGLLCDARLWRRQLESLADVCAPMVADLTLDDTVQAMAARTLAAAPPRFALAALSMGGYVALEIMRQAPERVERLALIDTSARGDTPQRAAERRAGIDSLRRGTFVGVTRRLLESLVHASNVDTGVGEELRAMAGRVGGTAFLRQQQAILDRPGYADVLAQIAVPTMIVVGEDDRVTPPAHSTEMHEAIAGSTLHVVRQCGHMATLEQPEQVNFLLRGWLAA